MRLRRAHLDVLQRCLCPRLSAYDEALRLPLLRKTQIRSSSTSTATATYSPPTIPTHDHSPPQPTPSVPDDDLSPAPPSGPLTTLDTIVAFEQVQRLVQQQSLSQAIRAATPILDHGNTRAIIEVYGLLIRACTRPRGDAALAIQLYKDMAARGFKPTIEMYHALLQAFSRVPVPGMRNRVLDEMKARWMMLSDEAEEWVLLGRICDGDLAGVVETIGQRRERGDEVGEIVYYRLGMKMTEFGDVAGACDVLRNMEQRLEVLERLQQGHRLLDPDRWNRLWFDVLMAASRELNIEATKFAWDRITTLGLFTPDSGVCMQVLHTAARHGSPQLAEQAAAYMQPSEGTYAAVLEAHSRAGNTKQVFNLLSEMRQQSITPTVRTIRALTPFIPAKQAFETLQTLTPADPEAVHLVMSAFIYAKDLESAFDVYKTIPSLSITRAIPEVPNTDTFNIILAGCAQHGQRDLAMHIAGEMREMHKTRPWVKPDRGTYEALITVCLNSWQEGRWKDAVLYFDETRSVGFVPRQDIYRDMALRCAEEGDLDKSSSILKDMEEVGWNPGVTKTALYKKWRTRKERFERGR